MNTRAQELGCTNTVFTNPTGLPDDNQHTTAHDMALIMQAAIQNESFRTIAAATSYTIPATNKAAARNLTSKFTMTDTGSTGFYEGCIINHVSAVRKVIRKPPEVHWYVQPNEMA